MSELEKTVADILVKATNAAEAAGKFAVEQLPDIAQQYVLYVALLSWGAVLLGVLVCVVPVWITWYVARDWSDRHGPPIAVGIISNFIGWMLIGLNIHNAILATWAPKVLLIKWAATLVK